LKAIKMSNTNFKFNAKQYNAVKKALSQINIQTRKLQNGETSIPKDLAETYVANVREAILRQDFPISYRPLSKRYRAWKKYYAPNLPLPSFWRLSGSVMKNLKVKMIGKGVVLSGLMRTPKKWKTEDRYSSKNKNPYSKTAQTDSTGYAVMVNNMRPLFRPVFEERLPSMMRRVNYLWSTTLENIWR